ncbi:hypothetical protein AMTR_s00017p00234190, partial [Amborella trichopoda]
MQIRARQPKEEMGPRTSAGSRIRGRYEVIMASHSQQHGGGSSAAQTHSGLPKEVTEAYTFWFQGGFNDHTRYKRKGLLWAFGLDWWIISKLRKEFRKSLQTWNNPSFFERVTWNNPSQSPLSNQKSSGSFGIKER